MRTIVIESWPEVLDLQQTALYLGYSMNELKAARGREDFPKIIPFRTKPRYRKRDLDNYLYGAQYLKNDNLMHDIMSMETV